MNGVLLQVCGLTNRF